MIPFFAFDREDGLHIWMGPLGLHLFWPVWKSRPDWCGNWRETL